jgi:biopolymer transport protein ExbB
MGMVQAFDMMQQQGGSAKPADLAGGISTALTHTFMGLFLAVPCLAAFGVLRTIVDRLTIQGALIAEEMLLMVKPAEAKPGAPAGAPRAVAGAVPQPAIPGVRKPGLPTPAPTPVISG